MMVTITSGPTYRGDTAKLAGSYPRSIYLLADLYSSRLLTANFAMSPPRYPEERPMQLIAAIPYELVATYGSSS